MTFSDLVAGTLLITLAMAVVGLYVTRGGRGGLRS